MIADHFKVFRELLSYSLSHDPKNAKQNGFKVDGNLGDKSIWVTVNILFL